MRKTGYVENSNAEGEEEHVTFRLVLMTFLYVLLQFRNKIKGVV